MHEHHITRPAGQDTITTSGQEILNLTITPSLTLTDQDRSATSPGCGSKHRVGIWKGRGALQGAGEGGMHRVKARGREAIQSEAMVTGIARLSSIIARSQA